MRPAQRQRTVEQVTGGVADDLAIKVGHCPKCNRLLVRAKAARGQIEAVCPRCGARVTFQFKSDGVWTQAKGLTAESNGV